MASTGSIMMAEESTSFPGVTRPVYLGASATYVEHGLDERHHALHQADPSAGATITGC